MSVACWLDGLLKPAGKGAPNAEGIGDANAGLGGAPDPGIPKPEAAAQKAVGAVAAGVALWLTPPSTPAE